MLIQRVLNVDRRFCSLIVLYSDLICDLVSDLYRALLAVSDRFRFIDLCLLLCRLLRHRIFHYFCLLCSIIIYCNFSLIFYCPCCVYFVLNPHRQLNLFVFLVGSYRIKCPDD